jgi:hypothetical protein
MYESNLFEILMQNKLVIMLTRLRNLRATVIDRMLGGFSPLPHVMLLD